MTSEPPSNPNDSMRRPFPAPKGKFQKEMSEDAEILAPEPMPSQRQGLLSWLRLVPTPSDEPCSSRPVSDFCCDLFASCFLHIKD